MVYEEYTITNNIKDGYDNYYTLSANRYKRILWVEGRKFGCDYFDTLNGNKTESIYYEQVHDTAYPNQHFVFSVNGDTVKEKSFYCSIYSNGHTIKKGDEFVLHAVLEAPIYQKAYIVIGDYDENYNLKRTAKRDTTNMYKFSTKSFSLDYHLGMNTVRGEIVNYEDYKDPITGQKKRRQKELFFRGEYFVKK